MTNFTHLSSSVDVSPLLAALERNPQLWGEITERQKYEGTAHADTDCIFLRWCKGIDIDAAFTEIPAFNFPAIWKLPEAQELINYTIHRVSASVLGRVLIVYLHAGGRILPHSDEGIYADHYERFHIALKSEPGNKFTCGGETVHMKPGELWWFNHKLEHSLVNESPTPRIHLIIDCVAPSYRRERTNALQ